MNKKLPLLSLALFFFNHIEFWTICYISRASQDFKLFLIFTESNSQFQNYDSGFSWFFWPITSLVCMFVDMHLLFFRKNNFMVVGSDKANKIWKNSSSWFGRLLSKCTKHEEDCANFCVLLREPELYSRVHR